MWVQQLQVIFKDEKSGKSVAHNPSTLTKVESSALPEEEEDEDEDEDQ